MNKTELHKYFKNHLQSYAAERGYAYAGFEGTVYRIEKRTDITILQASGRYLTRSEGLEVQVPQPHIMFTGSSLLPDILAKFKLEPTQVSISDYVEGGASMRRRQEASKIIVNDEPTFLQWASYFKSYWEEIVEPFFKKYISIRALNEKVNELTKDQLSNWFGNYPLMKKLIIMKWGNNPGYKQYEKEYLEHHENIKNRNDGKLGYALAAIELHNRLETEPIPSLES